VVACTSRCREYLATLTAWRQPNRTRARPSGEKAYKALLAFRDESHKPVYVLAATAFYMENIFDTPQAEGERRQAAPGWLGTAERVRLQTAGWRASIGEQDVYGYLLGTVARDGASGFRMKRCWSRTFRRVCGSR